MSGAQTPRGGPPLVDVHAHFLHPGCGRSDWERVNEARLAAGERIGILCHIASVLGSWGYTSPVYMPSPGDVRAGNTFMLDLQERHGNRIRSYVMVNPNDRGAALDEIEHGAARGAIGLKLAASRRADDRILDDLVESAAARGWPVLHHIWQNRRREWPGQEASDATELCALAQRHPRARFILAHIGGGGDYAHSFAAVQECGNVFLDLSGSGVDRGMLDGALRAVGSARILFGSDVTMETALAKLRALPHAGADEGAMADIMWRNAARIFPEGAFPMIPAWKEERGGAT